MSSLNISRPVARAASRPASAAICRSAVRVSPARYVMRRAMVGLGVIVGVVGAMLITTTDFADATSAGSGVVVVVQPGDTFWSIARSIRPTGDIRPLVAELAREHGHSSLQPGDRISVPAK